MLLWRGGAVLALLYPAACLKARGSGTGRIHNETAAVAVEPRIEVFCIVTLDWNELYCKKASEVGPDFWPKQPQSLCVNAINGQTKPTYRAFQAFEPYRGPPLVEEGLLVDFFGFKIPTARFCNGAYSHQVEAHAIRTRQCAIHKKLEEIPHQYQVTVQTQWPVIAEEYPEYSDVLDSVLDFLPSAGKRPFVLVELGAGYGHWTFTAHKALMQKAPEAEYRYVLVEAMSEMRPVVENLALLNNVTLREGLDAPLVFHHGYLGTATPGNVRRNNERYARDWGVPFDQEAQQAQTVDLAQLFELYKLPCKVDLVDIDIQGAEYPNMVNQNYSSRGSPGLFHGTAAVELLTRRVRRVHIGTHGGNDEAIVRQFESRGWMQQRAVRKGYFLNFEWGPMKFGDGILSFINRNRIVCD